MGSPAITPRPLAVLLSLLCCAALASGCRVGAPGAEEGRAGTSIDRLDGSRWVWLDAECSDGPLDLGVQGLEQTLSLSVQKTDLLLTYETALATRGCTSTEMWLASVSERGGFRFEPQVRVTLPAGVDCGAKAAEVVDGSLRLSGDTLEVVASRSPWCRGFDARFVYRRAPREPLDVRGLVTRYVAHFNRRDAQSLAALFAESGSLVEPFSRTADGNFRRHQGRGEIRAWYASAFETTPWLAMRLLDIDVTDPDGQVMATWEYMDPNLAKPVRGRNIFVLAGGEIFESELQLESEPVPASTPASDAAKAASAATEAHGG